MTTPKIAVENVSKSFYNRSNNVAALENINLKVDEGEFVCIVGPSGCGKSTLLHLIAGLEFPDSGLILDEGVPVTKPGNSRMMMFQEPALFPWLNVIDNVLYGLNLKESLSREVKLKTAREFLKLVGLSNFSNSNIHELSGGMKQRVALARALAPIPHVLLMDEPFAALDAMTREQLYTDIQAIQKKQNQTVILVTHNILEAVCLGDRVILFATNPGRVKEECLIRLKHPRDVRSLEVAELAMKLTASLRAP